MVIIIIFIVIQLTSDGKVSTAGHVGVELGLPRGLDGQGAHRAGDGALHLVSGGGAGHLAGGDRSPRGVLLA